MCLRSFVAQIAPHAFFLTFMEMLPPSGSISWSCDCLPSPRPPPLLLFLRYSSPFSVFARLVGTNCSRPPMRLTFSGCPTCLLSAKLCKFATADSLPAGASHFLHSIVRMLFFFFPQQRKLMGSSAQISSGVCRCGSQEQVPEEGSGRFRRVPACVGAGVGSGGGFRKVPESSDVKQCKFRRVPAYAGVGCGGKFRKVPKGWFRKVSEGSGGFWRVPARVGVGSGGRVRKVPKSSSTCRCRFRRQSSGVVCCLATLTGAAM